MQNVITIMSERTHPNLIGTDNVLIMLSPNAEIGPGGQIKKYKIKEHTLTLG